MINLGFVKVAAAIPNVKVANCKYNIERILGLIEEAEKNHVKILEFPELSISGYTCADLFYQQLLIEQSENALKELLAATANKDMVFIVGMPISYNSRLFNTAVVCQKGKILGVVPKSFLPNTNEFYEKRWFSSGSEIPAGIWYWIAATVSGLATMVATISTIHSATGYAQGGIVKGNSYSGDNIYGGPDAMVNAGELVLTKAQQSTLASALQGNGLQNMNIAGRIKGTDIILSIDRSLKLEGKQLLTWGR